MTPQSTATRNRRWTPSDWLGGAANTTTDSPAADTRFRSWEGRLFGGLVLSAFLLYGIGSALIDEPIGLVLGLANSVAVATIGAIGFRLLRNRHPRAGAAYLAVRIGEAIRLGGGLVLHSVFDNADANTTGYLLAMIVLSIGSIPFWLVVGQGHWLSLRFTLWAVIGYLALATGGLLELTTGQAVAIIASVPGGLFEVAVGIHLLRRGFANT